MLTSFFSRALTLLAISFSLSGCDLFNQWFGQKKSQELNLDQLVKIMPVRSHDRKSWARDILAISDELAIGKTPHNMCSIIAIIDQESNFHANPEVAGLGQKAVKEIRQRLEEKFGTTMGGYFETMLQTKPTPQNNYLKQMTKVRTEQQLDVLFREIFAYYSQQYHVGLLTGAAKLVGQDVAERFNPVTTLGSMQVHIRYAAAHKRQFMSNDQLRDDLYTQYGGLYYGIHRLMRYNARYTKPIYRFADYNAGMYSSRNAAFQKAVATLSGTSLDLDGDLLLYTKEGDVKLQRSSTEDALIQYFARDINAPTPRAIRNDLKQEKNEDFEQTKTYQYIVQRYRAKTGTDAPYAIMPQVIIQGPKLKRNYNTSWYAEAVNNRYLRCMQQAK